MVAASRLGSVDHSRSSRIALLLGSTPEVMNVSATVRPDLVGRPSWPVGPAWKSPAVTRTHPRGVKVVRSPGPVRGHGGGGDDEASLQLQPPLDLRGGKSEARPVV